MAKLKLLRSAALSVVNSNGEWFSYVTKLIPQAKLITYSLHGTSKNDLTLLNLPFKVQTSLIGDFNLENILASIATATALNIPTNKIEKTIKEFKSPIGRQEIIKSKNGSLVMVDFAHTPNSFERILPTLRKTTKGKIIHVFGSAGERDKGKRPQMGKVSSYYSDIIVLTSEDPRNERVEDIILQIREGIIGNKDVHVIPDRMEAIRYALSIASKDDAVLITGKGHEKTMNFANVEVAWSDQEAVKKILKS